MRDEIRVNVPNSILLDALTGTEVAVVADAVTISSPSAQTAFVTLAMLCVRSGHKVYLVAPDMPVAGIQPPFVGERILSALMNVDGRIVPEPRFEIGAPAHTVDLEVRLGATPSTCAARATLAFTATAWETHLLPTLDLPWPASLTWPFGAQAGASLAATEAFKAAMRKLRHFARDLQIFDELFAPVAETRFALASPATRQPFDLGRSDIISGGAITNAALYALSRIPGVRGVARVFEFDIVEATNLNRYALLLRDQLGDPKVAHLAALSLGGLSIEPMPQRYEDEFTNGTLAGRVLVGVDHIPSRWSVQRAQPLWLGIGATTHWSAMASFHQPGLPCAGCLHPYDDPAEGPIPTVAFVSFMAGLQLATYFLQDVAGETPTHQQTYLTVLRPETLWRSAIARHPKCPVGHDQDRAAA